jgi:hypothetical protein
MKVAVVPVRDWLCKKPDWLPHDPTRRSSDKPGPQLDATSAASPRLTRSMTDTLTAAGPPLLFGLRLWASVCLAL